ncbi:CHAT domain-containing protein [Amycolatopsis balhimycina]|uniref:CHAT domain-containing protein n=1 Tax=Amycolatopsis balhimycina TaxID=208443 RepID=UPI00035DD80B|nr:CHAT domain-containing protein [Amycolatopsis balhimycina]
MGRRRFLTTACNGSIDCRDSLVTESTVRSPILINLLILAANPRDTDPLRLGEETRRIDEKIRESSGASQFSLRSAWAVTVDELMYQLNAFKPNVVHFVGHGAGGQIVLETTGGLSRPLTQEALSTIFSHFQQWLQVVVLNACYSAVQAETLAQRADAVIGMTDRVGDAAAIEFSAGFYRALGFGRSVGDAFAQGVAMVKVDGLPDADTPKLIHRAGVDPAKLVLAGTSDVALSVRRAEDPRVPARLRSLLHDGCEFLLVKNESVRLPTGASDEENRIFLELGMRQSKAVFVAEVDRYATVEDVAAALAHRLLPRTSYGYAWTLVADEVALAAELSLVMAGLKSGDQVKLVGNHLRPEWAPDMR